MRSKADKGQLNLPYTQSDSKGGSRGLTPQRILKLTHQEAEPVLGRSLICAIALLPTPAWVGLSDVSVSLSVCLYVRLSVL